MEFEEIKRLLASVVDFVLDEANIEKKTDISDEAAECYQNDFYEINNLENQEESKMDIDKPSEDVSEFEEKQRQIFIELFKSGKYFNASSIYQTQKLKWARTKYLMHLSIINWKNSFKMIKDYQVNWELKRCLIKQKKNALNLLKITATCHQEKFLLF